MSMKILTFNICCGGNETGHSHIERAPRIISVLEKYKPEHVEYVPLVHDDDPNILRGEEARQFLVERIAKAALEAWNNRSEGAFAFAFGRAAVGLCRRVCYDDGSAKMWGDTNSANFTELEAGNDGGIEMLFTFTVSQPDDATFLNEKPSHAAMNDCNACLTAFFLHSKNDIGGSI